jgi:putative DNA methylase
MPGWAGQKRREPKEGWTVGLETRIEGDVPVEELYQLALREGNSKKPVYEIHKWWARRLGGVFRMLLLLATAPASQSDDELWRRFYEGDDLSHIRVLDPFMGGGTSIVEATKLRCQSVGVDIDPVAWFATRQEIAACDVQRLEDVAQELAESDVVARIRTLYQTTVPCPAGDDDDDGEGGHTTEADVIYNFWVDELTCPHCRHVFEAHHHHRLLYKHDHDQVTQTAFCRACHEPAVVPAAQETLVCHGCGETTDIAHGPVERGAYTCPGCGGRGRVVDLPRPGQPLPKCWFSIEYLDVASGKRLFKAPDAGDLARYRCAESLLEEQRDTLPIPRREIPMVGREDPRPTTYGYASYHQLFNARQLLALGWLSTWISSVKDADVRDYLMVAFSDALAANNLLCSFASGYDKLTPLFGLHAYNMITRPVENNVWGATFGRGSFLKCLKKVIDGKRYCAHPYESRYTHPSGTLEKVQTGGAIAARVATTGDEWYRMRDENPDAPTSLLLNQPSQDLSTIRSGTIDIILSDPPYYNNLSYSELSDFYYAWTRPHLERVGATWRGPTTPYREALFVNKQAGDVRSSIATFTDGLTAVFGECHRVLTDGGTLVFTFHHIDATAWIPLAQALRDARFVVRNVFPVRSEGRGAFHSSEGTVKWDVVLVCRKRKSEPTEGDHVSKGAEPGEGIVQTIATTACATSDYWARRLADACIPFEWPDAISLTYGCAVWQAVDLPLGAPGAPDVKDVLLGVSAHVVGTLPESAYRRIRRRKKAAIAL